MGTAWGAKQCHEPGSGAHAYERNVLPGSAGAAASVGGDSARPDRGAGGHGTGGDVPGERPGGIRERAGNYRGRWVRAYADEPGSTSWFRARQLTQQAHNNKRGNQPMNDPDADARTALRLMGPDPAN